MCVTQMKALSDGRLRNPSTECNNIVLTKLDVVLTNMHQDLVFAADQTIKSPGEPRNSWDLWDSRMFIPTQLWQKVGF